MGYFWANYQVPIKCLDEFIDYLDLNKLEYNELKRDSNIVELVINDTDLGHMDNEDVLNDLIMELEEH